jgi:hypothetical protein
MNEMREERSEMRCDEKRRDEIKSDEIFTFELIQH